MPNRPNQRINRPLRVIGSFFLMTYCATFALMALFWHFAAANTPTVKLYVVAASAAYAALYVLVPFALTFLLAGLTGFLRQPEGWRLKVVFATAWLGASFLLLAIYADYRLYDLYEYHFNGFVWNLITTPGGIDALGASSATMLTVAWQVVVLFVAIACGMWLLHRFLPAHPSLSSRKLVAAGILLMIVLAGEEMVFAYSTHTGQEELLQASEAIPFHMHTSATGLFKRLGVKRTALSNLRIASGEVAYPSHRLQATALSHYPNIIMLVGESFRWDLLGPDITPNLWQLANSSTRFENHYSGGNRTRMGLFSMFYGIYAPYWYSFERQRVAPALMEFLKEKDYQFALHTSQSFDYPELRHTLFTGIPEQYLQEIKNGDPWRRDMQNITDIISKLQHRDRHRPFFGFMFFESTHAPYTFPDDAVIRPDYQKDFDYINLNLQQDIEPVHARYINAAHLVDREIGRLLDHLRQNGMLDDTIILFTGDHGEEFMEKGHWGHGHSRAFPEEQIRVPLVLHLPGGQPAVVQRRTSHLQIAPLLLAQLGVTQTPHSFSSAGPIDADPAYLVAGEYDYMTLFDERYKITFPYTGSDFFRYTVHDAADHPVTRETARQVVQEYQAKIDEVVRESQRFVR